MRRSTGASEYDAMDFIVRQILNKTATATLVQVKAVNAAALGPVGSVDVQPMVAQLDGYGNAVPHGVVHNLPYLRYQGGTSAIILDPVVGDIGIAWFASHDLSSVKQSKAPGNPGSRRRFDMADGLYGGGFLNAVPTQFIQFDPATGITITSADGLPVAINAPGGATITSPTVTIDSPSASFTGDLAVTGNTTLSGDAHIEGDLTTGAGSTFNGKSFDAHTHGGVSTGTGTSGPPS
jgi:hypothetical protein